MTSTLLLRVAQSRPFSFELEVEIPVKVQKGDFAVEDCLDIAEEELGLERLQAHDLEPSIVLGEEPIDAEDAH